MTTVFHPLLKQFDDYLKAQYFQHAPSELYEPVNYMLQSGGKRIRPLLLLIACDVYEGNISNALPAAFTIELFHNFTLVHDDIMDNAPLRRGQFAVHQKYNLNTAILSGDVMMIWCYKYLQKVPPEKFMPIFHTFNEMAIRICEGQQLDMNFEKRINVSEAEYFSMIEKKTSALLAACLKMGAILADAPEQDCEYMFQMGISLGNAFQLKDDLLDAFGEANETGKERGGDIKNNKKTLLLIKALESAHGNNLQKLQTLLSSSPPDKVEEMLRIYEATGAKAYVEQKAGAYHREVFRFIEMLHIDSDKKKMLQSFADVLLNRMS
jgi:geranylgeranyl diphosphate synthase type II